ncbi:sensitivity to high expression protein she9 [Ceratobasidium sp. 395]|nr:sensitivity to high expression protein she9 [Ceratobasidium sp. 395]
MLRLTTTRRSLPLVRPITGTLRWSSTGNSKSGAPGGPKLNSTGGGPEKKNIPTAGSTGKAELDKAIQEFWDSLKSASAESTKKSTVDEGVSRAAGSKASAPTVKSDFPLGESKSSSPVASSKSSIAPAESKPLLKPSESKPSSPPNDSKPATPLPIEMKPIPPTSDLKPLPPPNSSSPPTSPPASSPAATSSPTDRAKQNLTIWKDATLALLRSRAQNAAGQLSELGGKLNKVTGYDEIEVLKRRVVERERSIAALRNAAREAKDAYSTAVTTRATRQRAVNDLLQRKSSWTDADVLSFTQLVREDHLSSAAEHQAKLHLDATESAVDTEFGALMRAILDRYHEEQVWSDKIRSVSTYGSLAALVANVVVFVLAIVLVEPWKRRRLAQTFERRIVEMGEETRSVVGGGMKELEEHFGRQEKVLEKLAAWATPVPVDHERPVLEPVVEPEPEVVPGLELPTIEKARTWLEALVSSTDRDYGLMAVGGVGTLAGLGIISLFRLSR